MGKERQRHFVQ